MELSGALRRFAAASPHALLAVAPGGTSARLGVERLLRERGWPLAASPAEADLLVVCGRAAGALAEAVERVWAQLPAPRVRVEITSVDRAEETLVGAQALLARGETDPAEPMRPGRGGEDELVAGLPLAERAPDRDGLELDRLELPLGPILADWPGGLVLRTEIQGDVVQEATVDVLPVPGGSGDSFWSEPWLRAARGEPVTRGEAARRRAAAHLDSLGRLLAVSGAERPAVSARLLRDGVLAGLDGERVADPCRRLDRLVRGSRVLHWSLAGLGVLGAAEAEALGLDGPASRPGGVWERALAWLDGIHEAVAELADEEPLDGPEALAAPRGTLRGDRLPSLALAQALPGLVTGSTLGDVRRIVASLDPDLDELSATVEAAAGG